jgi:hypothetical protein
MSGRRTISVANTWNSLGVHVRMDADLFDRPGLTVLRLN